MLPVDWLEAFAHIDADCFYATCERARHPELRKIPVCVLSSQEAIVVAKTYDAKAWGIVTGMPVWEARRLLPKATYLPADFHHYGLVSEQMFAILRRFSPEVEVYSIDEGFMGLKGLCSLWRKSYGGIADLIRETVSVEVGVTVSIGVSVTKTLAKIASESHKPNGTTVIPGRGIEAFLAGVKVGDIPGIGENREALLHKFGIRTALQYVQAPQALIQRLLGRMGTDLWHELRGIPLYPLELEPKPPKSIARTASLGMVTSDPDVLKAHLVHHVTRLTTELVGKELLTGRVWVFLRRKSFETSAAEARLHRLTASYQALCQIAMEAYDRLYQEGELYRGCGVIAGDIFPAEGQTPDLFEGARKEERQTRLVQTMDAINRRYGRGTLCRLATLPLGEKRPGGRFHYPLLEME
ncbi:MAG TPA: DNA polymerase IV [Gammaproteobacteria bacterium]|jgi:DNA polymerase-4/DNA polymerase V|nr:DNA polymerase IV [Gammaproteobacteria bacterium]